MVEVEVSRSSRVVKQVVGPVGWLVLEDIALDAVGDADGRLVARTTQRQIADNIGLSVATVARHLTRLRTAGYVCRERADGKPRGCYILDVACIRVLPAAKSDGPPGQAHPGEGRVKVTSQKPA